MKYQVEYNLSLDMGVTSGWTPEDEEFDTKEEAQAFITKMQAFPHENSSTQYRVTLKSAGSTNA